MTRLTGCILTACAALMIAAPTASARDVKCKLSYSLKGWSMLYKYAKGDGHITCSNGQESDVRIVTHGGGITFGSHEVIDGRGTFSAVRDINELYGGYAEATAHAGAGSAADARAMMKGNVNLSLSGTGQGINVGFAFGRFSIEPK